MRRASAPEARLILAASGPLARPVSALKALLPLAQALLTLPEARSPLPQALLPLPEARSPPPVT